MCSPLRSWFPDLNGEYDVELHHNWPIQQRMLEAATGGTKFDPRASGTKLPDLATTKLRATINVGFYTVEVDMWSENPDDPGSVIDRSRTIVSVLKRPCDGQPHRLVYVYQQKIAEIAEQLLTTVPLKVPLFLTSEPVSRIN